MSENTNAGEASGKEALSREEVESELEGKSEEIERHLDQIQRELSAEGKEVKEKVLANPLASAAGALAVGALIGLVVRRRRRPSETDQIHQRLVDQYMDAVADDVRYEVERGKETSEAVHEALRDRVPLIFYMEEPPSESAGFFRQTFDFMLKTTLGFAVKSGLDYITGQVGLEEYMTSPEQEGEDVPAVSAAVSEEKPTL